MARTALVTGGNRGLGLETARRLAAAGLDVVLTARDPDRAREAAARLGGTVRAEQLDVTSADSVRACADRLARDGVPVDVLVNNAGIYPTTPLLQVDEAGLLAALQANTVGPWRTCRAFVPAMRERGWGRVVNVSTGYAHLTGDGPGAGAYGLSKTALNVLTRMVAAEAGPGVLVNAADPGWVRTRMGGPGASVPVERGADTIVWLATLPDGGPTDGFWYERRQVPW
jgi:NAD(P)-dependent dehydrogenase (short-subunit alcohol dehydrogenase family)